MRVFLFYDTINSFNFFSTSLSEEHCKTSFTNFSQSFLSSSVIVFLACNIADEFIENSFNPIPIKRGIY